jgi:biotin carboxyl carrier protein
MMSADVFSPMPGTILQILVKAGDQVSEDDELIIMEAMKMEVPVVSPATGKIKEIRVNDKDSVQANQVLIVID